MGKVIVVQFVTADGVIEDPDGSGGTPVGGWAFHAGPDVFAGDKFDIASNMAGGVLLFGRRTWETFSTRWPSRTGEFADLMNTTSKVVASRSLDDVDAWSGSSVMSGDLTRSVTDLTRSGDVVVVGSTSIVRELAAAGLVDQYRLMVVPIVVGSGAQIFPADAHTTELDLASVTQLGHTALLQYDVRR